MTRKVRRWLPRPCNPVPTSATVLGTIAVFVEQRVQPTSQIQSTHSIHIAHSPFFKWLNKVPTLKKKQKQTTKYSHKNLDFQGGGKVSEAVRAGPHPHLTELGCSRWRPTSLDGAYALWFATGLTIVRPPHPILPTHPCHRCV